MLLSLLSDIRSHSSKKKILYLAGQSKLHETHTPSIAPASPALC